MQSKFLDETDPKCRIDIFDCNVLLWEAELGEEVKAWTMANWAHWEETKPDWFTDVVVATVPDSYIPAEFVRRRGGAERTRRGSAARSIRESMSVQRVDIVEEAGGGF